MKKGGVVLWRGRCGTLKRVVWYFKEGGVVLRRWWCGNLKRVVWAIIVLYFRRIGKTHARTYSMAIFGAFGIISKLDLRFSKVKFDIEVTNPPYVLRIYIQISVR